MTAVFKRDFRAYFTSPVGYVFCAIFLCLFNVFFYLTNVLMNSSDLSSAFSNMLMYTMFLVPVLTMRLFAEDFKLKTDQLLFTSPVKLSGIVLGKFFASYAVFAIAMCFTLIYSVIISMFGVPVVGVAVGNYVAFFAITAAFFAIGLFISSLTESQIVAGIISWGVFLGLYILDLAKGMINIPWLQTLLGWISMFSRYKTYTRGVFSFTDFLFYISVCVVFLFLTVRLLEKKRWS